MPLTRWELESRVPSERHFVFRGGWRWPRVRRNTRRIDFRTVGDLKPDLQPIMWKSLGVVLVGLVVALAGLRLLAKFMRMKN